MYRGTTLVAPDPAGATVYPWVTLSPMRFFSADAANLSLISPTAPAQEGERCPFSTANGGCVTAAMDAIDGAWSSVGIPLSPASRKRCSEDIARKS